MSRSSCLLALDLGTTTLAGRLLDPGGKVLAERRLLNPQAALGGDIMRRLEQSLAGQDERLQALLREGLRDLIASLLDLAGLPPAAVAAAAGAGNPGMTYLLRRLPPSSILFPPHRPASREAAWLASGQLDLGLNVPLFLFPLVSGYVGGDLVAFLYAQDAVADNSFFLDAGTNGEMALYAGGRWRVTSVAAGPAFEGGDISCGMIASDGAISDVALTGDSLHLTVIGGGAPSGLCGSGLAAVLAAALDGGLIDGHGSIVDPLEVPTNLSRCIVDTPQGRALRLYRDARSDVLLTQQDVRNFQLAKAAVRAGTECLLQRSGLAPDGVTGVTVTGAFGVSLPCRVLKRVAMFPGNMVEKIRFTADGVLAGVGRLLLDDGGPEKVRCLAGALQALPLSGTPMFEKAFIDAIDF